MTSDEAQFDPYYEWLAIPPAEQPPNLYRLLGLQKFESDPDVIENAADRQMLFLRQFQSSPRWAYAEAILNTMRGLNSSCWIRSGGKPTTAICNSRKQRARKRRGR